VLGFFTNDFGMQGGSGEQIEACNDKYKVTFDQFELAHVKGADAQPVFQWLISQPVVGPASPNEPTWNFHKYLVSREDVLVKHWTNGTYPGDDPNDPNDSFDTNEVVVAVKEELAKPAPP
jgi:glutathione peroxidase